MAVRLRGEPSDVLIGRTRALDSKPKRDFARASALSPGNGRLVDAEAPIRPGPQATT